MKKTKPTTTTKKPAAKKVVKATKPAIKKKVTKKANKDETTEIVCVLDRSTSIRTSGLTEKTIEGFNSFLKEQKEEPGKAKFTLCLFDGGSGYGAQVGKTYEIIYDRVDIKDVEELNDKTFVPRGMTAMYDAIGSTIDTMQKHLKADKKKSDKVIFLIMTDGEENSSREYNQEAVFKLIEDRKKKDNWAFLFIGANIDTMKAGGNMGISRGNTMSYTNTNHGVNTAYLNMSASVSMFRSPGVFAKSADFSNLLADNGTEKEKI
jgi:uncharacterized protein YegL